MSGVCRDIEHRYMGRKRHPHCRTCVCHESVRVQSTVRLTSPKINSRHPRPMPQKNRDYCRRCRHSPRDEWNSRDVGRERYRSVSPPSKMDRKIHSDHKFAMLESWFKRFDDDGNGLMDVYELKSLLNYLGVHTDHDYVKELIDLSDRDGDGMLSFSDFLHMWSQAAEEDMNLTEVIKENDLYPDILPSHHVPKHHVAKSMKVKETVRCKKDAHHNCCCCETDLRNVLRENTKDHDVKIETKILRSPTHCSDRLPVLSCHR